MVEVLILPLSAAVGQLYCLPTLLETRRGL